MELIPDEMLLGAASTCYIITYAAMLERSYRKGELDHAIGSVSGCYEWCILPIRKSFIAPHLYWCRVLLKKVVEKAGRLAEKAETSWYDFRAIKGNVAVELIAEISCLVTCPNNGKSA